MNVQNEIPATKTTTAPTACCPGFVLVVDDEEQNRALLRDPLEAQGHKVAEAQSGVEALQRVSERPPDVILLDVMMPKLDGYEVCRRLKRDPKTASIQILMVTALSERKERLMGIEAGANDFLTKPIDIRDVTLRVANAVYTKQLFNRLQAEQEKSDALLLNILPKPIAERMKRGEISIADSHPDVTVLFADLVGFTTMLAHIDANQVVYWLNEIFSTFDLLAEKHGLEKIKTIGDAFMVAGGIPLPRPDQGIVQFNKEYNTSIRIRIGICTGAVIAGVIGRRKFAYDLWGEAVNIASRLESLGEAGGIQVAESTYERLKHRFHFERKHDLDIKGRSAVVAYWLVDRL